MSKSALWSHEKLEVTDMLDAIKRTKFRIPSGDTPTGQQERTTRMVTSKK
jgi:hypothetical protein